MVSDNMIRMKKKRRNSNPKKYSVEKSPKACRMRAKAVNGMEDRLFRIRWVVMMKEERRKSKGMSSWLM